MGAMQDQFWGDRCGLFNDPEGYASTIATRKEDLTREEMDQRQAEWMKNFACHSRRTTKTRTGLAGRGRRGHRISRVRVTSSG